MSTGTKIFIGIGVIVVAVAGFFLYKWNVPPTFTVTSFDAGTGVAAFTFGDASGLTSGTGDFQAGYGWGLQTTGNQVTVIKNSTIYKTFTITSTGVINI